MLSFTVLFSLMLVPPVAMLTGSFVLGLLENV